MKSTLETLQQMHREMERNIRLGYAGSLTRLAKQRAAAIKKACRDVEFVEALEYRVTQVAPPDKPYLCFAYYSKEERAELLKKLRAHKEQERLKAQQAALAKKIARKENP